MTRLPLLPAAAAPPLRASVRLVRMFTDHFLMGASLMFAFLGIELAIIPFRLRLPDRYAILSAVVILCVTAITAAVLLLNRHTHQHKLNSLDSYVDGDEAAFEPLQRALDETATSDKREDPSDARQALRQLENGDGATERTALLDGGAGRLEAAKNDPVPVFKQVLGGVLSSMVVVTRVIPASVSAIGLGVWLTGLRGSAVGVFGLGALSGIIGPYVEIRVRKAAFAMLSDARKEIRKHGLARARQGEKDRAMGLLR